MNPLLIIGGALLIYSVVNQGRAAFNQLQYAVDRIGKINLGVFASSIDFTFSITNNTNAAATIQGVDGIIVTDGRQLGTFVTRQPITIQPGGVTRVNARANVTSVEFLRQMINVMKERRTPKIEFDGAITTQLLGRIPFRYTAFLQQDLSLKKA